MSNTDQKFEILEKAYTGRLVEVDQNYYEVPTSLFVDHVDVKMPALPAISFFEKKDGKITQIRKADQPYSSLALSSRESVLINKADVNQIKQYAESIILTSATAGTDVKSKEQRDKKLLSLRTAAINVVEDLFSNPSPENIKKSQRAVGSFVYILMRDPSAFLYLSNLRSHDPYTLQHSVGTSVNCIILARKMGINDEQSLQEVGLAGLLHDIGKTKVSVDIINKEGPLDDKEWAEMKRHSEEGYNIIKDIPEITERTKLAVLDHHEDKNGEGYPKGKQWAEVDLFARIVAISDVFNALTTNRSYSNAREPFDAFELMKDKLLHKLDEQLFKKMISIYGGDFSGL